jgi:hypothetical protein
VFRTWNDTHEALKEFETEHDFFRNLSPKPSELWMKQWERCDHPVFGMAHALYPAEVAFKPMTDAHVRTCVDKILKAHFPVTSERAQIRQQLSQFHSREGPFSLVDEDGDMRDIWDSAFLHNISPWQWWESVASAEYPELTAFAARILQTIVSSSASERTFSHWGLIASKLRNRIGHNKGAKALYCYQNWRFLEKSGEERYNSTDSDEDISHDSD